MPTRTTTRSAPPAELTEADLERAAALNVSPEVAYYLVTRGIPWPDCPPAIKTPEPRMVAGARFDPAKVDKVLRAFGCLRHTQGRMAGKALKPDPWQVAYILAPVFGWVRKNRLQRWVRIIRNVYVDVPRKNGKTTLSGGIAIYLTAADGEQGAQVLAAATTKDQARFCFAPIKTLCEKAPALKGHVRALASKILHPASGSYFEVISSVADAQHGANVHGAVIDELHVHKTADMVEAIETGTGSREQPLVVIITTADTGKPGTIYARKREYVEKLAKRVFKDPTTYGVVWAADAKDDPFAPETRAKANPGLGISPTVEYLEEKATKAQQSPAELASFLRLHLGLRTKQETRYLTLSAWDAAAGMVDESKLAGRHCHGGIDLSAVEDITALCWDFPDGDGGHDVVWRFWLPGDRLPHLDKRTAGEASVWVRQGWLSVTPGNVVDYDALLGCIVADQGERHFEVQTIGFDKWNSTDLVRRLGDAGFTCVPVSQGYGSVSGPLKEVQRLVLAKRYRHGGNPVMRWMVDNLAVKMDASGNVKPDKENAADKIDGVSAAVTAMREVLDAEAAEAASVYETRGLTSLG